MADGTYVHAGRESREVILVGTARSGKTWLGQVLACVLNATFVDEPDNHYVLPHAYAARLEDGATCYPDLAPQERADSLEEMWDRATRLPSRSLVGRARGFVAEKTQHSLSIDERLGGKRGRDAPRGVLSGSSDEPLRLRLARKLAPSSSAACSSARYASVVLTTAHGHFSIEWLAARRSSSVVLLQRDPRALLGAWHAAGWVGFRADTLEGVPRETAERVLRDSGAAFPEGERRPAYRVAWLVAILCMQMRSLAARHPEWPSLAYEEAINDPESIIKAALRRDPPSQDVLQRCLAADGSIESRRANLYPPLRGEVADAADEVFSAVGLS